MDSKWRGLLGIWLAGVTFCGTACAQTVRFEAEDFVAHHGDAWQTLRPRVTMSVDADERARAPELPLGRSKFHVVEASNDAFVGDPTGVAAADGDWVKCDFRTPRAGEWFFWARTIAATAAGNSLLWAVDASDANVLGEDNLLNFWEFRSRSMDMFSTDWSWYPIVSRDGPFDGPDPIQWNVRARIGLHLDAGRHTLHLVFDEPVAIDWFYASLERTFDPNAAPPDARSVDVRGQLPLTWADVKRRYASWGPER